MNECRSFVPLTLAPDNASIFKGVDQGVLLCNALHHHRPYPVLHSAESVEPVADGFAATWAHAGHGHFPT